MKKINLDQGWEYTEATGFAALFNPHAWQPVTLPHDAMISKPRHPDNPAGSHGGYFPGGAVSYRRKLFAPEEWRGQSVQLEFEGVYMNAEVTVNKQLVQRQPYGYSSFIVDIAPYLVYGQENVIGVIANNTAQPNCRWYTGTGIYRHVWLRTGGQIHIRPWGVFVTTPVVDPAASAVHVATELANVSSLARATLRSTVLDAAGNVVARVETPAAAPTVQQTLLVRDARLWSVDEPYLYTLHSEALVDGAVVDAESTTFGIRAIEVDAERGFRLNGAPLKLKGGCIHHDHGPLGAASYDRAEERKAALLKSAGYNAIRTAHNPPAPALLDACDRLGMLVIDESFDAWTSGKVTNDYHLYFQEWWQADLAAMIRRDRNHPSIIMWSIGNEIFEALGDPVAAELSARQADFVRALDPTRFVTSGLMFNFLEDIERGDASGSFKIKPVAEDPQQDSWGLQTRGFVAPLDVVGYNYMVQRYAVDQTRFPGRVIAGTETWGHRMYSFWKETERLPHVIGDFVWTALDYIGEAGFGAVSFDGQVGFGAPYPYHLYGCGDFDICGFKRPQSYYRDLLWGERTAPFIAVHDPQHYGKTPTFTPWAWEPVIDNWTYPGWEGKPTQVDVYAADDEVELFVNGVSAGRKPAGAASENRVSFDVIYEPGVIEAVGYTGGRETGRFRLATTGRPAALRVEADRAEIATGCGDLAYVTVALVDQDGRAVNRHDLAVTVEVTGAGELLAIGTGDPLSEEPYVGAQRTTFQGRLLAVVRSAAEPGAITVNVRADGLPPASIALHAR
ncbi:MAG: Beta-glucuronidase [Chloroflexi bacterium ADurb.Bin325]|nr:MAG: Beta-glucuronidase [Chloroflexi bacterium ADurb.Bin325]